MLAGALFNRATDIFTSIVDLAAKGVETAPDNELMRECEEYFGKVVYTGSHELSSVAVGKGKVDAAFVATHRFDNVVHKGEIRLEDDVLVGGGAGVYEGTVVKSRAVIGAGAVLTGSTPVYDLPRRRVIRSAEGVPVVIPEGAVVVPGARAVTAEAGREWGLALATPVIVKYRDEKTDASAELEAWLR